MCLSQVKVQLAMPGVEVRPLLLSLPMPYERTISKAHSTTAWGCSRVCKFDNSGLVDRAKSNYPSHSKLHIVRHSIACDGRLLLSIMKEGDEEGKAK